jgi:hypothetical protein
VYPRSSFFICVSPSSRIRAFSRYPNVENQ